MDRRSVLMGVAGLAATAAISKVAEARIAMPPPADLRHTLMRRYYPDGRDKRSTVWGTDPTERQVAEVRRRSCLPADAAAIWQEVIAMQRRHDVKKFAVLGTTGGYEWGPLRGWSISAKTMNRAAAQRLWSMVAGSRHTVFANAMDPECWVTFVIAAGEEVEIMSRVCRARGWGV